jgi:hypothetical protein
VNLSPGLFKNRPENRPPGDVPAENKRHAAAPQRTLQDWQAGELIEFEVTIGAAKAQWTRDGRSGKKLGTGSG